MARLLVNGAELQDATAGVEVFAVVGTPEITTTTVRSGNAAWRFNATGSEVSARFRNDSGAADDFVYRAYVRFASFPASLTKIIQLQDSGGDHTSIRVNSNGTLELWEDVSPAQLGSDSSALSLNTWYRIELDVGTTHTGNDVQARLDGTEFASTATHPGGADHRFIEIGVMGSVTCDMYGDDVAINNHSGSIQNSWPGAGQLVISMPNGAGDNAATAGTSSSIDEISPSDLDYIELDEITTIGDYNTQDSSTVSIGSGDTITLIAVGLRVRAETAAACTFQLRIKSASGGTVATGTTTTVNTAAFRTNDDTATAQIYKLISYTDPTTGSAWTPTGTNSIDNMQIGVTPPDATPDVWVSSLWAYIEATSLSGGTTTSTSSTTSTTTSTSTTTTSSSTST